VKRNELKQNVTSVAARIIRHGVNGEVYRPNKVVNSDEKMKSIIDIG